VVGITESMLTILYAIGFGLAMSVTPMVSRRIGEGDARAASRATTQATFLGILVSLPFAVLGLFFAKDLLVLMDVAPDTIAKGSGYTSVMLTANVVILLLFLNNAAFRGAGNAAFAMRALWLSNGINCILDPCLIFGLGPFPELGVTGAAVATTIGRGTGVLYQFWHLRNGSSRIVLRGDALRFDAKAALGLLRLSLGGIGQFLVATCSWVVLFRIVARFGDAALAGYTIGIRILLFTLLPGWGVGNAAATLVGQNLGAGNPDRAARAVRITGIYNMVFLGIVTLLMITCAEPLVALFTDLPEVRQHAAACVRTIAYGYPLYAWGMVTVQGLNGAGDTMTPTLINVVCFWVIEMPLAWLLAVPADQGPSGVFWSVAIAESLMAALALVVFRRGRWKTRTV
jgi:putative MATE family efflux protein